MGYCSESNDCYNKVLPAKICLNSLKCLLRWHTDYLENKNMSLCFKKVAEIVVFHFSELHQYSSNDDLNIFCLFLTNNRVKLWSNLHNIHFNKFPGSTPNCMVICVHSKFELSQFCSIFGLG